MKLAGLPVAAAIGMVSAAPAWAQTTGLAPSVPWTLDYAEDSCALRRMFGAGENRGYIELRRFEPGLGLQAVVASDAMKAKRPPVDFRYRFGSDGEWREVQGANTVKMKEGFSGVLFDPSFVDLPDFGDEFDEVAAFEYRRAHDVKKLEAEAAARVDSLTLRGAFGKELTLQLEPLAAPIKALNDCMDELMGHWGIDVEAHKSLTRPVVPVNLREVGRMIDYPPKMIQQNLQGVVNIRLAIDETGLVTGCHIQMPLSDPAFEKTSCDDIQHELDFDPALDKDGKPIASYWVTKVVFQLRR